MNYRRLYSKKVPKFDLLTKEIIQFLRDFKFWIQNGFKSKTIWIGPIMPSKKSTIYKIATKNLLSIRQSKSDKDAIQIWFDDQTKTDIASNKNQSKILNSQCSDISKKNVEKIQKEIFGYGMEVDPKTHQGKCVIKSDENAVHDGRIVQCPISNFDQSKVYQIIINNEENQSYFDYRVAVMADEIIIIYKKYKTLEKRFTNDTYHATICDEKMIPNQIQKKIIDFCNKIQCDFCELDVLFDNDSQKWFVIDVNKTPYGPPASLSRVEKEKAVNILSDGFKRKFL
ncbi:MAG: hypothetical protein RL106_1538 [Bacteroidota bacterium]